MLCPFCKKDQDRVLDSRPLDSSSVTRRRRECLSCKRRFTTYERLEEMPLLVVKSDKRREPFDRAKMREGILRACEKRPVPIDAIEKIVSEVEYDIQQGYVIEVRSNILGDKILEKLHDLDPVAYVRFASVYRKFSNLSDFNEALRAMERNISKKAKKKTPAPQENGKLKVSGDHPK